MNEYKNKTKEYYAKLAQNYPIETSKWRMDLISKYNKKNKKIIDLGCGTGNYLLALKNNHRYGVDFSKESITILKKRPEYIQNKNNIHAVVGDILHIPFKKKFDIIFSFSTVYYIQELEKLIREIKRIMNKDAIAILEFGNKYSINSIWDRINFSVPQFNRSYKEIKIELEKNDLEIITVKYRQIIPNFWKKFDNNYIESKFLQKISFRIIFIVKRK